MSVDRIRVDRIPGGVWAGARVWCCKTTMLVTMVVPGARRLTVNGAGSVPIEDCELVLDDPLGLGLTGLAARVAQRLGWGLEAVKGDGLVAFAEVLCLDCPWFPEDSRDPWPIVTAATYLALTDRLCDAVGLARDKHEVARWDFAPPEDHAGEPWLLETAAGCLSFPGPPGRNWVDSDRIPALEAALASVEAA